MRRAAGQPVLTRALPALLPALLVVVLAGCGGEPATAPTTPTTTSTTATPTSTPDAPGDQPRLADEPSYDEQFDATADDWTGGRVVDGAYVLEPGATASLPASTPPDAVGALAELGLVLGQGGAAALACDLGPSGTVTVELASDGSWAVAQTAAGGSRQLAADTLREGDRARVGELTALRLLCAQGADGLAVGVSFHGGQVQFVEGADGEVPSGGPVFTVTSTGAAPTRVDQVLLTPVDA